MPGDSDVRTALSKVTIQRWVQPYFKCIEIIFHVGKYAYYQLLATLSEQWLAGAYIWHKMLEALLSHGKLCHEAPGTQFPC